MIRSICDLSDDYPDAVQTGESRFRDYGSLRRFHGRIDTIKCHEDNLLLKQTLATPGQGRVMVVDGGGSLRRALFGDKLGALLVENGWAGIIVNGCVRDSEELNQCDIGIRALATHPRRSVRKGLGEKDLVIDIAGVTVRPGNWVYADSDGILISQQPLS